MTYAQEFEQTKKAREDRALEEREVLLRDKGDTQQLMSSASGRRIVYTILVEAECFRTTFDSTNPHATSFNEGKRRLGLFLLNRVMSHAPDNYMKMMKENAHENL